MVQYTEDANMFYTLLPVSARVFFRCCPPFQSHRVSSPCLYSGRLYCVSTCVFPALSGHLCSVCVWVCALRDSAGVPSFLPLIVTTDRADKFHGTASTPPAYLFQNMGVSVLFIVSSPSDDEMFSFFSINHRSIWQHSSMVKCFYFFLFLFVYVRPNSHL